MGGQETALFLSHGERLAKGLRLDRLFRLKVLPISVTIPWIINVGDFLGHVPLPAKITIQVLDPIESASSSAAPRTPTRPMSTSRASCRLSWTPCPLSGGSP